MRLFSVTHVYGESPFPVTDVNRSGPSLSRRQQEMDPENIHFDNEGLDPDLDDDGPTLPTGRESVGEAASNIAAGVTPTGVTGCSQSAQSGGTRRYSWNMPTIFTIASVMDPRIKIMGVEKLLKGLSEDLGITLPSISTVTALLTSIYASYESKFACIAAAAPYSSSIPCSTSNNENDPSWFLISGPGSSETSSRSELTQYLEINLVTNEEFQSFDILAWWKKTEKTFPILSTMARDLLTPPVSSVASESAFSAGNRVLDERRSRLAPDILDCLICLKDWEDARLGIQKCHPGDEFRDYFSDSDIDAD
ncbi:hypothetical protein RHSIM_Rhsim07G0152900 [Rhododendron simsii]|uniref:HAT C-terminal dimerisation domain-containing protein n=1 Tax=Rhododendron simsii TaxID=118357 RepID=A0A834LJB6_RHOSS|nr:hypothetical protein RHSIM_Rhsim07G0152900 [Rhododendron simsii]